VRSRGKGKGVWGTVPQKLITFPQFYVLFFLHFGMAFIVKCSLTIEHVIIAIPSIEACLKVRGFIGGPSPPPPSSP